MTSFKKFSNKGLLVVALAFAMVGLTAAVVESYDYTPLDKAFYLPDELVAFVRPGLNIEITGHTIGTDGTVTASFTISDDAGTPLDINGIETPGAVSVSWIIAKIDPATGRYVNYNIRTGRGPTSDSGGTVTQVGPGSYTYEFGTKLGEGTDMDATHTIAFYSRRDLREWDMGRPVFDGVLNFVPSGAAVTQVRSIVTNDACARCHDPLILHGRRHSVEVCILCHYSGYNSGEGESIDFRVMIHKIHRGANLPSVQAGGTYEVGGHNYDGVIFPQDIKNCETCHTATAVQNEAYYLNPTRDACGSCHDDVVWASGANHAGGAQVSDNLCANCHFPEGELEYDASVLGAHTVDFESKQLEGLNAELIEATHGGPGTAVTVLFKVTKNDGSGVVLADLNRFLLSIAGPNTDYTFYVQENAMDATPTGNDGEYTKTFTATLPPDATGSYTVGVEGRRQAILNAGTTKEKEIRECLDNTVLAFAVTDDAAVARRQIVDDAKCEACHEDLNLHGSNRRNASGYCQTCHSPLADDSPYRPAEDMPARSIDFKMLIHRIHTGEELAFDYTQVGYRGSLVNYNHVVYPGDRRNCMGCHVGDSWMEAEGVVATKTERELFTPMTPNAAACIGCHDNEAAQAHAYLNIAPFGEACMACHGDGRDFSVAKSHAR